ncbi:MAG: ABC transporter ATP-binding protein [Desulfobacula sp.]|nr:ABC transporter ATP-binding protein [Desulfobacula sp.]
MLKIENLNSFYGDVQVLFDVSLQINMGETIAIVGANAAGKSTLLRSISGLIKQKKGSVRFLEQQIINTTPYEIAHLGIIHIPQGRRVFPHMTVSENLAVGAYTKRKTIKMKQSLDKSFSIFPKLYELKNQAAGSLSGGEQQMLAIARGLIAEPRLITIDEPSLGLSPIMVENTFKVIEKINKENVTVLLVEQNVVKALELSKRAYVLENGKIIMQGKGKDLLADAHLKKAYLGM